MMDFPQDAVLELPSNITATYMSEGAANVVYTINVPPQGNGAENGDAEASNPWHGMSVLFKPSRDSPFQLSTSCPGDFIYP